MSPFLAAQHRPARASILHLCYLGIGEPLVQTQVVPYLAGLAAAGYQIVLLTFEPTALSRRERLRHQWMLRARDIEWHSLRYHKRPALPATLFDVSAGILYGAYLVLTRHIDVVHARGHVPAAMAVVLKHLLGARMVFDVRGLMADEYVDAGLWRKHGPLFSLVKRFEDVFLANADAAVVLTRRVERWWSDSGRFPARLPVEVIPCCVDLGRFDVDPPRRDVLRRGLALDGRPVMVYAGKVGGWYMLREMIDFFQVAKAHFPDLCFVLLTQSDPARAEEAFASKRVGREAYRCLTVLPSDLPAYLSLADFAISFRAPRFSQIAASPTKMAEYLAAGLPIVYNAGIGDLDELEADQVGACVRAFTLSDYGRAVGQLRVLLAERAATGARCRAVAREHFSLAAVGIAGYLRLYAALADLSARGVPGGRVHSRVRVPSPSNEETGSPRVL